MTPEEAKNLTENSDAFETTFVGTRTSQLGVEENVGIDDEKRVVHVLNTGKTGSGKTQVMIHAALQDAYKGHGFCMLIPKGAALDQILAKLPEDRLEDVIYINPNRAEVPSINVLEPYISEEMTQAQKDVQKEIITSDLIDLCKRRSDNWGDQFGRWLETLLIAHIDLNTSGESKTLEDVYQSVVESEKLTKVIEQTQDRFLKQELDTIKQASQSKLVPLKNRLGDFMRYSTVQEMVSADQSGINFRDAVNNQKIILVDIREGEVGGTVSQLVGSIVITKIWAAAQSRITQQPEDRTPFYLYIDELQNFGSEGSALSKMLAQAREYGLGCWLATQYLSKLDPEMQEAVINNCRTKVVFDPTGSENSTRLTRMLNGVDKSQLNQLVDFRAVLQTPSEQVQDSAAFFSTYPPWEGDRDRVNDLKDEQAAESYESSTERSPVIGNSGSAGKELHKKLLAEAKKQLLELEDVQVNLLYQSGDSKPDGIVFLPDATANLEAECATLSKPAKVLTNLKRAVDEDRECIFVVEEGERQRLENIVEDPVNRRGDSHEDEQGNFDYYTGDGGDVTEIEELQNAEYRIIEIEEERLIIDEPECPELGDFSKEELEIECFHRTPDGHCSALNKQCVVTGDD